MNRLFCKAAGVALAALWGATVTQAALPLSFQANRGQLPADIRFLADRGDSSIAVAGSGFLVGLRGSAKQGFRVAWVRNGPAPLVEGAEPLPGKVNYLDRDPARTFTDIPTFARVRCRSVWPGIDVELYSKDGQVEYDFVVAPGADPRLIRMRVEGVSNIRLEPDGAWSGSVGEYHVRQPAAVLLQEGRGKRRSISGRYRIRSGRELSFVIDDYDPAAPLIIDPTLIYSAKFGQMVEQKDGYRLVTRQNGASGLALDAAGAAYVVGTGLSTRFNPLPGGGESHGLESLCTFVAKLNPQGTALVYQTYFGRASVDPDLVGPSSSRIALDAGGNAYVLAVGTGYDVGVNRYRYGGGSTGPTVWVLKLNAAGNEVLYSAALAAASNFLFSMAVDASGAAYVGGIGYYYDVMLVKLSADGSRLDTIKRVANSAAGISGLALDPAGNIYVGAGGSLFGGPTPGAVAAGTGTGNFAKLRPNGEVVYVADLGCGASFGGEPFPIAADSAGNAYVSAQFYPYMGIGLPEVNPPPELAGKCSALANTSTLVKLSPDGSRILFTGCIWNTSSGLHTLALAVNDAGLAVVGGYVTSNPAPGRPPELFTKRPLQAGANTEGRIALGRIIQGREGFVTLFDTVKSELIYSTYLGGVFADAVWGLALDRTGNVYAAGTSDHGNNVPVPNGFPHVAGSYRDPDWQDTFIAKIAPQGEPPRFTPQSVVSAADFKSALAPNSIGTIFGSNLSDAVGVVQARTVPLPTQLAGSTVRLNDVALPLLSVSNVEGMEQINFIVPPISVPSSLEVEYKGMTGYAPVAITPAPAIFVADGQALVQHGADYSLVTQASPARKGEIVTLYVNGIGAVDPPVAANLPTPMSPLSRAVAPATVLVGGVTAEVLFAGLSSGAFSLGQINFRIPAEARSGNLDVVVAIGGYPYVSRAAKMWVE